LFTFSCLGLSTFWFDIFSLILIGRGTLWLCQQFAIENGHRKFVDLPSYKMVDLSIVMFVYQRVKHPNISYLFISHIPIDWGNGLTLGSSFQGAPICLHQKIQYPINCQLQKKLLILPGFGPKKVMLFQQPYTKTSRASDA
jgi:hypothetical protein